jgi:hypothetical protein
MLLDTPFSHINVQQNQDLWSANLGGFLDTPFLKPERKAQREFPVFTQTIYIDLEITGLKTRTP